MPRVPTRFGVIGLSTQGWASTMLIPPLLELPLSQSYELRALCTSKQSTAEASAKKYTALTNREVKAYWDPQSIVSDPELDLIVVSVPTHLHFELVKAVIEADKDVFVEWGAGRSFEETRLLTELAKKHKVRSMVGLQGRQGNAYNEIKKAIERGDIGDIVSSSTTMRTWGPNAHWGPNVMEGKEGILIKANGGSLLENVGGEFLELFTYLLGPITSLSSTLRSEKYNATVVTSAGTPTGGTAPSDGPTQVVISGTLKSKAVMSLHIRAGMASLATTESAVPLAWVIDGSKGSIRIESRSPAACWVQFGEPTVWINDKLLELPTGGKSQVANAWTEFLKDDGNYVDLEGSLGVKKIIEAVWESDQEGRRIVL